MVIAAESRDTERGAAMRAAAFDAAWAAACDLDDDDDAIEHYEWSQFAEWWLPLTQSGERGPVDLVADRDAWDAEFQIVLEGSRGLAEFGRTHQAFVAVLAGRGVGAAWAANGMVAALPPVGDYIDLLV